VSLALLDGPWGNVNRAAAARLLPLGHREPGGEAPKGTQGALDLGGDSDKPVRQAAG